MEELHTETAKEIVGRVHAEPGTLGRSVKIRLRVSENGLLSCRCFHCVFHKFYFIILSVINHSSAVVNTMPTPNQFSFTKYCSRG